MGGDRGNPHDGRPVRSARAGRHVAVALTSVAVVSGAVAVGLSVGHRGVCGPGWQPPSARSTALCAELVEIGHAPEPIAAVAFVLAGLPTAAVGAFVAVQRRHVVGWLLLVGGVALTVGPASGAYFVQGALVSPGSLPGPVVADRLSYMLFNNPGLFVPFVLALLLFPTGRPPSARWRVVVAALAVAGVIAVLGAAVDPLRDAGGLGAHPVGAGLLDAVDAAEVAAALVIALGALGSVGGLWLRWRQATGVERMQLRWVGSAALAMTVLIAATPAVFAAPWLWPVWPFVLSAVAALIPTSMGIAILRHRLYDLDLVINRAAVYAVLSGIVVVLYVSVVMLTASVADRSGERFGALAVTALVAVGWQPARVTVQRGVDRLLFGRRAEPYALLTGVGRQLGAAAEPTDLLQQLVDDIAENLRLPYVAVVSSRDDRGPAAASGTPAAGPLEHFPLVHAGEEVGRLVCAGRRSGEPLSGLDRRLLTDLAGQIGAAVHAGQLVTDLRRSRRRVVEVAAQERERLRRDLHDGLGPALTGIGLAVGELEERAATSEDRAALRRIQQEVRETIDEVRRIAQNLRPAVLDQHGLATALAREVERFSGPDLDVQLELPERLDRLSPAAELAVYRVTSEALTNVRRHADARTCRIRLTVADDVVLQITDDGTGIAGAGQRGIGLRSMAERADQFGGTCTVEAGPQGGTMITARLPVGAP